MTKILVSAILDGRSHMLFDNVTELNSRALNQAITMRMIGGRILGRSETVSRPNIFLWSSTGNNPTISNEMARRLMFVNLNAKTSDLRSRTYSHDNLEAWTLENRPILVWALLTIIQSWIANGSPRFTKRKMPSFGEWVGIVGGILTNAGITGFLDNPRASTIDLDHAYALEFIQAWFLKFALVQTPMVDILSFAVDLDLDIAEGKTDKEKKVHMRKLLERIEGKTFALDDAQVTVRRGVKDGLPTFGLISIETD
jgi:putative DNA primase/helicase